MKHLKVPCLTALIATLIALAPCAAAAFDADLPPEDGRVTLLDVLRARRVVAGLDDAPDGTSPSGDHEWSAQDVLLTRYSAAGLRPAPTASVATLAAYAEEHVGLPLTPSGTDLLISVLDQQGNVHYQGETRTDSFPAPATVGSMVVETRVRLAGGLVLRGPDFHLQVDSRRPSPPRCTGQGACDDLDPCTAADLCIDGLCRGAELEGCVEPITGDLLVDGHFERRSDVWLLEDHHGVADLTFESEEGWGAWARVRVSATGVYYTVQLQQIGITVVESADYELCVSARANHTGTAVAQVGRHVAPWNAYGDMWSEFEITEQWNRYCWTFTSNETDENARLGISVGSFPPGTAIDFDAFTLRRTDAIALFLPFLSSDGLDPSDAMVFVDGEPQSIQEDGSVQLTPATELRSAILTHRNQAVAAALIPPESSDVRIDAASTALYYVYARLAASHGPNDVRAELWRRLSLLGPSATLEAALDDGQLQLASSPSPAAESAMGELGLAISDATIEAHGLLFAPPSPAASAPFRSLAPAPISSGGGFTLVADRRGDQLDLHLRNGLVRPGRAFVDRLSPWSVEDVTPTNIPPASYRWTRSLNSLFFGGDEVVVEGARALEALTLQPGPNHVRVTIIAPGDGSDVTADRRYGAAYEEVSRNFWFEIFVWPIISELFAKIAPMDCVAAASLVVYDQTVSSILEANRPSFADLISVVRKLARFTGWSDIPGCHIHVDRFALLNSIDHFLGPLEYSELPTNLTLGLISRGRWTPGQVSLDYLHCLPDCEGRACGEDSCGGNCGHCPADSTCQSGACVPVVHDCEASQTCEPEPVCGTVGAACCGNEGCDPGLICVHGSCHAEPAANKTTRYYAGRCGGDTHWQSTERCHPGPTPSSGCGSCPLTFTHPGCSKPTCHQRESGFWTYATRPNWGTFFEIHHCFTEGANRYQMSSCAQPGYPATLGWIASNPIAFWTKPIYLCGWTTPTGIQEQFFSFNSAECVGAGGSAVGNAPWGYVVP